MALLKAPAGFLLGLGNRKLGDFVYTYSLPAVTTCPGRSRLCEKACYALRGTVRLQQKAYDRRHASSLEADFVDRMVREIRLRDAGLVRLHVSGDFYSAAYVRKWAAVAAACPGVRFFAYTRSWRVPAVRRELARLARLPNFRLWYSCDKETGLPPRPGRGVRVAYMAVDDVDAPPAAPDLAFRVKRVAVRKRIGGAVVCPVENGTAAKNVVNCQKCGLCWEPLESKDARRFKLPMAS